MVGEARRTVIKSPRFHARICARMVSRIVSYVLCSFIQDEFSFSSDLSHCSTAPGSADILPYVDRCFDWLCALTRRHFCNGPSSSWGHKNIDLLRDSKTGSTRWRKTSEKDSRQMTKPRKQETSMHERRIYPRQQTARPLEPTHFLTSKTYLQRKVTRFFARLDQRKPPQEEDASTKKPP